MSRRLYTARSPEGRPMLCEIELSHSWDDWSYVIKDEGGNVLRKSSKRWEDYGDAVHDAESWCDVYAERLD